MSALYEAIKDIAREYDLSRAACAVVFGVVTGAEPLKIKIDQKTVLTQRFLSVARHLTDYTAEFEVDFSQFSTTGTCSSGNVTVNGPASGKGSITVKNGLKTGDRVILLRLEGGGGYVVADRVG